MTAILMNVSVTILIIALALAFYCCSYQHSGYSHFSVVDRISKVTMINKVLELVRISIKTTAFLVVCVASHLSYLHI